MHRDHHGREQMFGLAHHPRHYERFGLRLFGRFYRRMAADVAGLGLPPGSTVLDVGTGPGILPREIARRCPDLAIEGVDLSPEMVGQATAAAAGLGHVTFRVADVARLPHPDGSVDLVVSSLSLHHWADQAAGLREVARVLRPGGRAWIYDVRSVLRHARTGTPSPGDGVAVEVESPLAGTTRLNPIGRLVLVRDARVVSG